MHPKRNYDNVAMLFIIPTVDCSEWEENLNMPATAQATPSTPVIPDRSLSQRMDALAKADDIRKKRAKLKREIKARKVSAINVLEKVPEYCETMKVSELLRAVPNVGRVKCRQIMGRAKVKESRSLVALPAGQRSDLITEIGKIR